MNILTRGLGQVHKLLTRGFGKIKDVAGPEPDWMEVRKIKKYTFDIFAELTKRSSKQINIYNPLKITNEYNIFLNLHVFKEIESSFRVIGLINSKKLFEILDNI